MPEPACFTQETDSSMHTTPLPSHTPLLSPYTTDAPTAFAAPSPENKSPRLHLLCVRLHRQFRPFLCSSAWAALSHHAPPGKPSQSRSWTRPRGSLAAAVCFFLSWTTIPITPTNTLHGKHTSHATSRPGANTALTPAPSACMHMHLATRNGLWLFETPRNSW